jgi:hypothetical protein
MSSALPNLNQSSQSRYQNKKKYTIAIPKEFNLQFIRDKNREREI